MPATVSPSASSTEDAALGAILGALCGDAAGAVLEFIGHRPRPDEIIAAMEFQGGGVHRLAPGQITDDGELTLCLLHALVEMPGFSLDRVAGWYGRWIDSSPFDVGNATSAGLRPARGLGARGTEGLSDAMRASALRSSSGSKANGSLMRCTPLGVFGHALPDDALVALAREDSSLTHPNPSCCDAVAAYTLALAHLVHRPGDRTGAWSRANAWVARGACDDVRGWMRDAEADRPGDCETQIGFVKHGFTEAFRQLRRGASWDAAVRETLALGGDTDTNACIVGGIVGAAGGAGALPTVARERVIQSDTRKGRERPAWLHPRAAEALASSLFGRARQVRD